MNNLVIVFREKNAIYNDYDIEFTLESILYLDDSHAQLEGSATSRNGTMSKVIVDYYFNDEQFFLIANKKSKKEIVINGLWNDMTEVEIFLKSLSIRTRYLYTHGRDSFTIV
jgi:hypothetical protein